MTTNGEWLDYLAHNAPDELAAWFDAEHVEHQERALDGDTEPENEDSRERLEADIGLFIADYMPTEDSPQMFSMICSFIDRQASITEREHPGLTISDDESLINWRGRNYLPQSRALNAERERDEFSLKLKHEMELNRDNRNAHDLEQIAELTAERDELQERLNRTTSAMNRAAGKWAKTDAELRNALDIMRIWISDDAHLGESAISYEFEKAEGLRKLESIKQAITVTIGGLEAERDNWKANCEDWKKHARAAENACYETMLEREHYREKFGKCLDYADAIHALMDEEGVA